MSTRRNNGSHYENHQRAAELQDAAAHAYRAAGQCRSDHLTAAEQSRLEREQPQREHGGSTEPLPTFGHEEIANLAYGFWQAREGRDGTAEDDWFRAVRQLRERTIASRSH
jgi:hypothetical protein